MHAGQGKAPSRTSWVSPVLDRISARTGSIPSSNAPPASAGAWRAYVQPRGSEEKVLLAWKEFWDALDWVRLQMEKPWGAGFRVTFCSFPSVRGWLFQERPLDPGLWVVMPPWKVGSSGLEV